MKKKLSVFLSLLLALSMILPMAVMPVFAEDGDPVAEDKYEEFDSPSVTYNMNVDWKFKKAADGSEYPLAKALASVAQDGVNFYQKAYDDSGWETVSVPHPINAEDSFDDNCYDAGEAGIYRGFMFYRKYVTIPETDAGKKLFLEFEAARNSVYLYVNEELVGYYEAGIAPVGFDITDYVTPGEAALIAVATDNCSDRGQSDSTKVTHETKPGSEPGAADGYGYQWNTKDFNEVQGGLTGNVNLYAKGKIYQTLPLYNNLKTTGNYIYGSNYDIDAKSATINVKAEVRNETDANANLTVQVDVVGMDGKLAGTFTETGTAVKATDTDTKIKSVIQADAYDSTETYIDDKKNEVTVASGATPTTTETVKVSYITASATLENLRFWSDKDPYLYTVYTYLIDDNDNIIDAQKTVTGFRKVEYTISGGLKINDKYTYLKGYAQRSTNEWAVIGVANDWLTDIDMQLLKESNGNHIRWMHVAPKPVEVRSSDKYGVIVVCPAGDKEGDAHGRTWDQRVEAMRDAMIYFRNSPSVLFWEAGNNAISATHMQEMTDLRGVLDPNGGRFAGSRTISSVDQIKAAEYVGTMINRHGDDAKTSMASANKYMPIMETEYARDEAPRRVWDDFSPPDYDYVNKWLGKGGSKQDGYDIWDETSEDFAVADAKAYDEYWSGRVTGGGDELYTGAAIMVWSDSNMHNRNTATENCRTSGKVDAVRIKKQAFYALQAVQSDTPKIKIIGHWNYPEYTKDDENGNYWYFDREQKTATDKDGKPFTYYDQTTTKLQRDPTKKTVYVIGSPDVKKVELYINDELVKTDSKPDKSFVYEFTEIDVTQSGEISAIAYDEGDKEVATDSIKTVGDPDHVKLTPVTGPDGLIADGSDIMYYDVAIVDNEDNVCPLAYDRIDLKLSGDGVLLGGYNSGVGDKITTNKVENNQGYTNAECGVNRVFVRSTRDAGTITLTATVNGLGSFDSPAITSVAFENKVGENVGLSTELQRSYAADAKPPVVEEKVEAFKSLAAPVKANFAEDGNTYIYEKVDTNVYYTVSVGGEELNLANELRARASSVSGIYGPAGSVIAKLKTLGAVKDYSISQTDPKVLAFTTNADKTYSVRVGKNAIYGPGLPDEGTEITEDVEEISGEIFLNYNAVFQGYIPGVSVTMDESEHTCAITYTPVSQSSVGLNSLSPNRVSLQAVTETALTAPSDGKVTVAAAAAITNAKLIFAVYDETTGALKSVDASTSVTMAANETKDIDLPDSIPTSGVKVKAMLWKSLADMEPLCPSVEVKAIDYSKYEKVQYTENFNSNDQTDGPDGTGYFQSTAADTLIYDGVGAYLASDSLLEMDFRFDSADATMRMSNGRNKTGMNISLNGTTLRTETSKGHDTLGTVNVGEWYKMELEGKIAVANAYADFRLYKYENGVPVLINTVENVNLRNFANGSSGYADNMKASAGISADNVKITSLYASEVEVTAIKEDINANESVQLTATATRKGKAVTIPTFEWKVFGEDGNELTGDSVTVTDGGFLVTTVDAETQTVMVRATATTEGKPYGEKKINITAIDTSNDTFDTITLESDKNYVRTGQNTTITPTAKLNGEAVTPQADEIVWSVYNEANIREVNNIGIKVQNGVVSVEDYVLPQVITVRASNKSGSAVANVKLNIKPGNMILADEEGNKDTFVTGNACEELVTGLDLRDGSWDGSGYYKLTSAHGFAGFAENTTEHVLYSADIRFDEVGSGWDIVNANDGRFGMQGRRTKENELKIENGSTYIKIDPEAWYNISIMCSTGNKNAYAHMIIYKYKNGVKVHPETEAVGEAYVAKNIQMRNLSSTFSPLSPANHMNVMANTSVDNVYCAKTTPDAITVTADKTSMFAGQSIQGTATATRQGVPFGYISSDLIKWVVYDEKNEKALGSDLITVDASGKMTVDALADSQTVYLRAATLDGTLFDAVEITISTSDIFTINQIGFNDDYTKVQELKVKKNFSYSDNVTFVVAVYDSTETTLKSVITKTMSAKNIAKGDEPVAVSIEADMPADFDKAADAVYVYAVTSLSENEAVTEDDGTITASLIESGTKLSIEAIPEFDTSSPVIVLVLKPGTVTTAVTDEDIVYVKQFTGTTVKDLSEIAIDNPVEGDYIIKIAGKQSGVSTIATGVVTQPAAPTTP